MSSKTLPKFVTIRWEEADEPYLSVFDSPEHAAEQYETHTIGIYELKETKRVKLVTQFVKEG